MPTSVRKLVFTAMIGAIYAALTMALAPISYGALQFRISEVMCILPFFVPWTAWGLFVGCALANLLGPYGILDVVFGSLATLLAGLCTAAIGMSGKRSSWLRCIAACLMPVLWNGIIVAGVITATVAVDDALSLFVAIPIYALTALEVAGGEAVILFALGLPLLRWLPNTNFFPKLLEQLH
jgi:uncharacterized membrane protein